MRGQPSHVHRLSDLQAPEPETARIERKANGANTCIPLKKAHDPVNFSAELSENSSFIRLTVDMPGVNPSDVEVSIQHGVLAITGVRRTMSLDGAVCIKKLKFARRYAVDTDVVDVMKANATLDMGVLTISAPKKSSKPRSFRIPVLSHNGIPSPKKIMVRTLIDDESHESTMRPARSDLPSDNINEQGSRAVYETVSDDHED